MGSSPWKFPGESTVIRILGKKRNPDILHDSRLNLFGFFNSDLKHGKSDGFRSPIDSAGQLSYKVVLWHSYRVREKFFVVVEYSEASFSVELTVAYYFYKTDVQNRQVVSKSQCFEWGKARYLLLAPVPGKEVISHLCIHVGYRIRKEGGAGSRGLKMTYHYE